MNEQKEKFTPGQWVVLDQRKPFNEYYDFSVGCSDGYDDYVCRVENCMEEEANAHLIAAAPEMYRLLCLIEEKICQGEDMTAWRCAIGNVLRKARGEE